jgi:hypothetical protein
MRKIDFEVWMSDQCKSEVHFFMLNDQSTYVMGANPEFVKLEDVVRILANLGYEFPTGATKAWIKEFTK